LPSDSPTTALHADVIEVSVQLGFGQAIQVVNGLTDQNDVFNCGLDVSHREDVVGVLEQNKRLVDGIQTINVLIAG
jgi:hypothetical protein